MNKLRSLLPGQHPKDQSRHSVSLEPEIGFQITIDTQQQQQNQNQHEGAGDHQVYRVANGSASAVPELNVHLIAARHLPSLFGFKIVQGYLIKVIKKLSTARKSVNK